MKPAQLAKEAAAQSFKKYPGQLARARLAATTAYHTAGIKNPHKLCISRAVLGARPSRIAAKRHNIKANGFALRPLPGIRVVVTGINEPSTNDKTGDFLQVWIFTDNISPTKAIRTGQDARVCFDCIHRQKPRSCYVNTKTLHTIWSSTYPDLTHQWATVKDLVRGSLVRLTAYGDPFAVPDTLFWERLFIQPSAGHSGFTQNWNDWPEAKGLFMASCTVDDQPLAELLGWSTFTTLATHEGKPSDLRWCASTKGKHCFECKQCPGKKTNHRAIVAHGIEPLVKAYDKKRKAACHV